MEILRCCGKNLLERKCIATKKKYFSFVFEVYQNMIGSFWVNYMHEIKAIIIHFHFKFRMKFISVGCIVIMPIWDLMSLLNLKKGSWF